MCQIYHPAKLFMYGHQTPNILTYTDTHSNTYTDTEITGVARWMSVFTCLSALNIIYLLYVCTSEELCLCFLCALWPSLFSTDTWFCACVYHCACQAVVPQSSYSFKLGGNSFVFLFFVQNWILVPKNNPAQMLRRTGDPFTGPKNNNNNNKISPVLSLTQTRPGKTEIRHLDVMFPCVETPKGGMVVFFYSASETLNQKGWHAVSFLWVQLYQQAMFLYVPVKIIIVCLFCNNFSRWFQFYFFVI